VLLQQQQSELALWRDAWLTATGHKRPGLAPGRPIEVDPQTGIARWLPKAPPATAEKPKN